MKPRATASALERVFECPASVVLPQITTTSEWAARGTTIHGFARNIIAGVPYPDAIAQVEPEWQEICRAVDFSRLGADLRAVRAEAAYAWNVHTRTARFLGLNIGREYEVERGEIPGTNDIEGVRLDGVPVVIDIKTGQRVTVCRDNPQMMFHALMARSRTGAEEVQARILYIAPDGSVSPDTWVFDSFDLDAFADDLEKVENAIDQAEAQLAEKGTVTVHTGDWCKHCPAMQVCPAYVGMARRMVTDLDDVRVKLETLTPEEQGRAWVIAKQAEVLAETVLDGLKKIVKANGPIPLADGSSVRSLSFVRNDFNGKAALKLLRDKGVPSEEIQRVCYKDRITEQVRRMVPKQKGTVRKRRGIATKGEDAVPPELLAPPPAPSGPDISAFDDEDDGALSA